MIGLRLAAIAAVLILVTACASGRKSSAPAPAAAPSSKEIVVRTDKGEAVAQEEGARACAKQGKRAELTGYTCGEGTCKVMRYTFDCV